jgi:hypothetical protein
MHPAKGSKYKTEEVSFYRNYIYIPVYIYSCDRLTVPLFYIRDNYKQRDGILKGKRKQVMWDTK